MRVVRPMHRKEIPIGERGIDNIDSSSFVNRDVGLSRF